MPRLAQTNLLTLCFPCTPYWGGEALDLLLSSPGRGIMMGSRASSAAGAVSPGCAAHISDNLLCSARSVQDRALPTPLPCWHPALSAHLLPGLQGISCVPSCWDHPNPGTSFLRSCPLIQALRAGRLPLQNKAPSIFRTWMLMCM